MGFFYLKNIFLMILILKNINKFFNFYNYFMPINNYFEELNAENDISKLRNS